MSYPGEGGGILFFGSWYLHTSSIFETILLFTFIYNHELCQNKMSYYQEKNCFIILNSMTVLGAFCDAQDPVPSIELPMLTVSVGTGVLMIFSIEDMYQFYNYRRIFDRNVNSKYYNKIQKIFS